MEAGDRVSVYRGRVLGLAPVLGSRPGFMMSPRSGLKSGVLSSVERGTGLDQGEGEFLPVGPRGHGAGLLALSSLALGISVRLQCVLGSHQRGFKTGSKMRLFLVNRLISSHFVSFTFTYLERAKRG